MLGPLQIHFSRLKNLSFPSLKGQIFLSLMNLMAFHWTCSLLRTKSPFNWRLKLHPEPWTHSVWTQSRECQAEVDNHLPQSLGYAALNTTQDTVARAPCCQLILPRPIRLSQHGISPARQCQQWQGTTPFWQGVVPFHVQTLHLPWLNVARQAWQLIYTACQSKCLWMTALPWSDLVLPA